MDNKPQKEKPKCNAESHLKKFLEQFNPQFGPYSIVCGECVENIQPKISICNRGKAKS